MNLIDFVGDLVLTQMFVIARKYELSQYNEHNIRMIKHVLERSLNDIMHSYRNEYATFTMKMTYSPTISSFYIDVNTINGSTDIYFHLEC